MKIQNLNNATTFITSKLDKIVLDPWVVGNLYQNSWSAFPYFENYKNFFDNISHVLITHFHADHFDPETLKLINKNAKIVIPNLKFNSIMKKSLDELGFKKIIFLELSKWHKITESLSIYIIPPLNEMAQEIQLYEKFNENNNIAIDTGVIIYDNISETSHIFLADNSPYDLNAFKEHTKGLKCSSFWFPYNGFAGDYPLCYDNLSINEKKKISLEMSMKREECNLAAIKECNPEIVFPYSSDFTLHGPYQNDFFKVHDERFYYKHKYAERVEKLSQTKALALYGEDNVVFKKNSKTEINLFSNLEQKKLRNPKMNTLSFPEVDYSVPIIDEIKLSLKAMFERVKKYNLNMKGIEDWFLCLKTEKIIFNLDLDKGTVSEIDNINENNKIKKNILLLKSTEQILRCLMQRKIHFDNAQIGCYLSWERHPNKFNKSLYDALCFFHI